jgi:alpha-ribazole phosphatase
MGYAVVAPFSMLGVYGSPCRHCKFATAMIDVIKTTVDLMRHGTPLGGRRYRGQTDDPLSDVGWQQMHSAVGDQIPWKVILSSPLLRCVEFAKELAARHDLPLVIDARLKELGYGEWEGRTPDELLAESPERLNRFRHDPVNHAPLGAEPLAAFRERVLLAWEELNTRYRGQHVLVIGHAGVIRLVVHHILGGPLERMFRLQVPCASVTRVQIEHGDGLSFPQLLFLAGNY